MFLFVGLANERSLQKRKVNTQQELLARNLDSAACTKKRDPLRRSTRDFRTGIAKFT